MKCTVVFSEHCSPLLARVFTMQNPLVSFFLSLFEFCLFAEFIINDGQVSFVTNTNRMPNEHYETT